MTSASKPAGRWSALRAELAKGEDADLTSFGDWLLVPSPPAPASLRARILEAVAALDRRGSATPAGPALSRARADALMRELSRDADADLQRFADDLLPRAPAAPPGMVARVRERVDAERASQAARPRAAESLTREPTLPWWRGWFRLPMLATGLAAAAVAVVLVVRSTGGGGGGETAQLEGAARRTAFGWAEGAPLPDDLSTRVSAELEVFASGVLRTIQRDEGEPAALAVLGRMRASAAAPVMARGQREPLLARIDDAVREGRDPWSLVATTADTPEPTLSFDPGPARVLAGASISLSDTAMSSVAGRGAMLPLLLRERDHCPPSDRSFGEISLRLAELARDRGDHDAETRYLDEASAVSDDRIRARAARLREPRR